MVTPKDAKGGDRDKGQGTHVQKEEVHQNKKFAISDKVTAPTVLHSE